VLLEPEPLGAYYGPVREQRELVRLTDVPQHLIDAVLSVEDQRFATHSGIDLRRIAGAMLANLRAGRVAQGGSTLTQQLVKNFFLTPERTWRRKLREAFMALIVEARYDKHEILEAYLNEIYLGQRGATAVHGVGEAAHLYFGKSVSRVSVAEAGLLAAIIQSPNGISPYRDPDRALKRRNLVLELMVDQGASIARRSIAPTTSRSSSRP
jgi:penicillin-binding protein 1B